MLRKRIQKKHTNTRLLPKKSSSRLVEKRVFTNVMKYALIPTLGGLILVFISFVLLFFLIKVQQSPYFSLKNIDVKGNKRLSTSHIISLAGITEGDNVVRIRLGSLYQRLYKSKWVKHVAVRKTFPDTIHIDIEELEASFWVQHDNTLFYADALGFPITSVEKDFFVSLPVLEIEKGAEDFVVHLPAIMNELHSLPYPLDAKNISWIKLLSTTEIQFFIESANLTITLALENWRENIRRVQYVIQDLHSRGDLQHIRKIYANSAVLVET